MKLKNRFLVSALAGVLVFSSSVGVFAQEFDATSLAMEYAENSEIYIEDIIEEESIDTRTYSTDTVLEDILSSYHLQMQNVTSDKSLGVLNAVESSRREIQEETVRVLNEAGYEAYDVNPSTFDELQIVLATDFNALGLESSSSYIIVIEGEGNDNTAPYATAGSSFTHTYGGTTYTMRYLTVTAADDPAYGKADTVDVLASSSQSAITNCLNTALSAYISAVSSPLGTVASLCGLDVSKFNTSKTSTLSLNGGSNWTRIYTQVWSTYDNAWALGSCVEYVKANAYMSGQYYSASQNKYVAVPTNAKSATAYSSNYSDTTWRKNQAAIGFNSSSIKYNTVGDAAYKYGSSTKITHRENF